MSYGQIGKRVAVSLIGFALLIGGLVGLSSFQPILGPTTYTNPYALQQSILQSLPQPIIGLSPSTINPQMAGPPMYGSINQMGSSMQSPMMMGPAMGQNMMNMMMGGGMSGGMNSMSGMPSSNSMNGMSSSNGMNGMNSMNGMSSSNGMNGMNSMNGMSSSNGMNGMNSMNGIGMATGNQMMGQVPSQQNGINSIMHPQPQINSLGLIPGTGIPLYPILILGIYGGLVAVGIAIILRALHPLTKNLTSRQEVNQQ